MKVKKNRIDAQKEADRVEKITLAKFFSMQFAIVRDLMKKYRLQTTGILIFSVVTLLSEVVELKFLEYAANGVSRFINGSESFRRVAVTFGLFLSSLLVILLLSNIYKKLNVKYQSMISFDAEKRITDKLSKIPYEYYEFSVFYDKINLARDVSSQYGSAVTGVSQIIRIVVMLAVYCVLLSRISILYIGIVFVSILVSIVISSVVTEKRIINRYKNLTPNDRRNAYFGNILGGRVNHQNIQTTRAFPYFAEQYEKFNNRTRAAATREAAMMFGSEAATSILFIISFFFTVMIVGRGVASGAFEIGYFTMVVALLTNLFGTVQDFTYFVVNRTWYIRVLEAYYDILALEEVQDNEDNTASTDVRDSDAGLIEVNGLSYKYPQAERYALDGIDISFRRGEKIAVVGYNGSGKSTFMSVLLGLLSSYSGDVSAESAVVTAVLQDFGQYQMTVKENIEIGCGGISLPDEKIEEILEKVGLYDFIMSKPKGIYTSLGQLDEDGVEMSKGQYQRLAIGRLLANEKANVWILDEPTAFLDPLAEIEMYKFIFSLSGDRLVFFISHRLGFAKNADRIVVIKDGKVAEDGTHNQLLERGDGIYKEMFASQLEWYK